MKVHLREAAALRAAALLFLVFLAAPSILGPAALPATPPVSPDRPSSFSATGDHAAGAPAAGDTQGRRLYLPPSPTYPAGADGLASHQNVPGSDPPRRMPLAGYNRTIGDHRAVMLLVDFQDVAHAAANNLSKYDAFANGNGSTDKTLRTFLYENSAGNYTLNVTVVDWVTMPQNMAYYATASGENKIAVDAAGAADSAVNFSQFDEDGDGYVDNLIVVHAGNDQAVTGDTNDIWSFEGVGNTVTVDGKTVRRFATVAEDITNGDPVGVLCHEFGHLGFDLPDLYDVDLVNAGLGDWDTMAYGGWAGGGAQPNGYSAWTKLYLGWIAPTIPSATVNNYTMYPMTNASSRNPVKIESNFTNEYFLVEFRWRNTSLRFDRYVPTSGLVIYHVNETTIANNWSANTIQTNTAHKGVDIEEVGTQDMDSDPANTGSSNDVWVNSTSGFGPNSTPNSNLYRNSSGYVTGIRVFNISAVNLTGGPHITFSIDAGKGSSALSGAVVGNATQTVQPGASANFTVQFSTASGAGDNLTVSAEGTFGGANVTLNRTNVTLSPLGSGNVTLTVTLPSNCTAGSFVDVQVRANSTAQPSQTFGVSTRTQCGQAYAGNLSGPSSVNASAGVFTGQNFTVGNLGNGQDFFALNVSANASLVNMSLNITGFNMFAGANATFRINFTVSGSVTDGTVIPFSINASYGPSGSLRAYLNGTITARSWALTGSVVGNTSSLTVQPSAAASYPVRFTTASSLGDNLTITTEGSFAGANVALNRTAFAVGPNGSGTVNLTVTLPANCTAGTFVDVGVRATSVSDPGASVAVTTRTTCAQVFAGNVSGASAFNATANVTYSQNYTVRNTGNGADNFTVAATYNASLLGITFSETTFSLAAGANATARLNFTVAASVADGTVIPFSLDLAFGPSSGRHAYLNGTLTARSFALNGTVLGNNANQTGLPGAPVNFTVQFTTASGAGDNATVSAEGSFGGASVSLDRSSISLAPLGSATVLLTVTMPANCQAGSFVDVLVRANSTGMPSVTTTVATRTVCGQVFAANLSGPSSFSVAANSTLPQNYTLRNAGNGADDFTLSATYNASLLAVTFAPQSQSLGAGVNGTSTLSFAVAAGVSDGTLISFSIDLAFGASGSRHTYLNGTVTARSFAVSGAVLNNATQTTAPGTTAVFTVQFTTASGAGDNVTLTVEGSWGGATVNLNRTSLALGPLGSATVALNVTLPGGCAAGTYVDVQVRANSTGQASNSGAAATRTLCGQVFAANLSGAASVGARINVTVPLSYTLRNTGNGPDNFTVTASTNASLLTVAISGGSKALAGGANGTVAVNFTVTATLPDGTVIPFSLDVAFGPSGSRHAFLNGTVTTTAFPLTALALNNSTVQTVLPGATATFFLQFATGSSGGDNVTLSLEGSFAGANASLNRTAMTFGPLGSGGATLTVTLPGACSPGATFDVVVRATSASQTSSSAAVSTQTICAHVLAANLSGPSSFAATANQTVSQNFSLQNAGNGDENFTVTANANGALVTITVIQPSWSLTPGGSGTTAVHFRVSAAVQDGTLIPFSFDAAYGPALARHAYLNGTITARSFAVTGVLLSNGSVQSAVPGVAVDFLVRFTTASLSGDTVDLAAEGTFGSATVQLNRSNLSLGSLGSGVVALSVTLPVTCLTGEFVDVLVRGKATGDPASFATVQTRTVCGVTFGGSLLGPVALSAMPGVGIAVDFTIQNEGSGLDSYALLASSAPSLTVATPPGPVLLYGGGAAVVQVTFTLAMGARAGDVSPFSLDLAFGAGSHAFLNGTVTALRQGQLVVSFEGGAVSTVDPTAALPLNATVTNGGNYQALVSLTASATNGFAVALGSPTVYVPAFSAVAVVLWVSAPGGAAAGFEGSVSVTVETAAPAATATTSTTVRVGQVYKVDLSGSTLGSGVPGALVTIDLAAFNSGNGLDHLTIYVEAPAAGWGATASPGSFALAAGAAPVPISFQVVVPAGTLAGVVQEFTVRVDSELNGVSTTLKVRVRALPQLSFAIAAVGPGGPVGASGAAAFDVTVSNTGNVAETYVVEVVGLPSGWPSVTPASVVVAPGGSAVVHVNVTPPANALAGSYTFGLRVWVQGSPARNSTLNQTVEVAARHQLEMAVAPATGSYAQGSQVLVNVTLRNRGNVEEQVTVAGSGDVTAVTVDASPVTVPAFGSVVVQVLVRLRADQPPGPTPVALLATSPNAAANGTLSITVAPAEGGPPGGTPPPPPENFLASPLTWVLLVAAVGGLVAFLALRARKRKGGPGAEGMDDEESP